MMQESDLQELAERVCEQAPMLSLYLNVDPHRRSTEEYKLSLRRLMAQAASQGATEEDIERVERYFEHEYDRHGKGVACFSHATGGFWRQYVMDVPMVDFAYVGKRPYVKPLSDIWDEYDRFGVISVDREGAKILAFHLGKLEDSVGIFGSEVKRHKQGGWAAQKLQRYEDQEAKHNLRDAAEWADEYLREHRIRRVVLSGIDDNVAVFRDTFPRALQERIVGQINLDMNATPSQVWERAFEVAQDAQRRAEQDLLEQVITTAYKGGAAAIGMHDTLVALQAGRIHQLLLSRDLHVPGLQCNSCHSVLIEDVSECPYCQGQLSPTGDAVNLAVHSALDSGVKVSVLDPSPRLDEIGGIAAVLRY